MRRQRFLVMAKRKQSSAPRVIQSGTGAGSRGMEAASLMSEQTEVPAANYLKGQVRNAMINHRAENPFASVVVNMSRVTLTVLTIAICGAVGWPQATAHAGSAPRGSGVMATAGDHGPITIGNGKRNKNYSQVFSPTIMRGVQHVSNASVTGDVPSQSAFCKKRHRVCHISEKLWMSRSR
jgi:hypothetical protein